MRFAVVGTNFISDNFADAVKKLSGVSITAVYSRAEETGTHFAKKHRIENVFTSYEQMLGSHCFDAVYVASPTLLHCEHTIKAREFGYHVLCEKMMAATLEEFYRMKDAANSYGKVLLEAMRPFFDPAYASVSCAMEEIGKVRRATLEFCQYSSRYDRFKAGILTNAFDPKMKNSALSDIGIYPLNIAINLFGEPQKINASSVFLHNGFEGEGSAILSYPEKLVTIIYSKISDSVNPSVIEGEEGSITIDKLTSPQKITLKKRNGEIKELYFPKTDNNMTYEIEAFVKMAEGEISFEDNLLLTERVQKAVDKIYKASKTDSRF